MDIRKTDALELLKSLDDKSVDMILTDPPYYKLLKVKWDNQWKTKTEYLEWLESIVKECQRVLKDNGSFYMFCQPSMLIKVGGIVDKHFNVLNSIRWCDKCTPAIKNALGMRYYLDNSEEIIFAEQFGADYEYETTLERSIGVKCHPIRAYLNSERVRAEKSIEEINNALGVKAFASHYFISIGQWVFPSENRYNQFRILFGDDYLTKPYTQLKEECDELRKQKTYNFESRRTFKLTADKPFNNTWRFKQTPTRKGRHPCEKPADLIRHIIGVSSNVGDLIVDPFCGSCVVPKCCETMGRRCIAGDMDDEFF